MKSKPRVTLQITPDEIHRIQLPLSELFNSLNATDGKVCVSDENVLVSVIEAGVNQFICDYEELLMRRDTANGAIRAHFEQKKEASLLGATDQKRVVAWKKLEKLRRGYGNDVFYQQLDYVEKRIETMEVLLANMKVEEVCGMVENQEEELCNFPKPKPPRDPTTVKQLESFCSHRQPFVPHNPEVMIYHFGGLYYGFLATIGQIQECFKSVVCEESIEEYNHLYAWISKLGFLREHVDSVGDLVCRWIDDVCDNLEDIEQMENV